MKVMAEQHDVHGVASASISSKMVLYLDGSSSTFTKAFRSFSINCMASLKLSHVGNPFTVCTSRSVSSWTDSSPIAISSWDVTMKLDSILFTWPKYPFGKNSNKDVKCGSDGHDLRLL
ncbi:hypothetical protein ACH5RR_015578 [Cinchona calisaya]|uniref:Uncharacterized protein n=1 Tax=Cinchona calisaya TaxID=153742 RepID=A0ABD2ZTK7_9GENT